MAILEVWDLPVLDALGEAALLRRLEFGAQELSSTL